MQFSGQLAGPSWRQYGMTYPAWSAASGGKYVDFSIGPDVSCEKSSRWPIDWAVLRHRISGCMAAIDLAQSGLRTPTPTADSVWLEARQGLNSDNRVSSHRNDCYLGNLAFQLCEHTQALYAGPDGHWEVHLRKLFLELEAAWFHFSVPWSVMLGSRWSIGWFLGRLSAAVREAAARPDEHGQVHASMCDSSGHAADEELFSRRDAFGVLPPQHAEPFIAAHGQPESWLWGDSSSRRCPFGFLAAVLSIAIWVRTGLADIGEAEGRQQYRGLEDMLDTHVSQFFKVWEEQTTSFFFDVLSSKWRLMDLMELVENTYGEGAGQPVEQAQALGPTPKSRRGAGPLGRPFDAVAKPRLPQVLRVLFLGGGATTHKWTSFTQRGRQMARGLRELGPVRGADAVAWNADCQSWCDSPLVDWYPDAIVHVKHICSCCLRKWRRAVHVYDPIDVTTWIDTVRAGSIMLQLDAILMTTSLGTLDLRTHPVLQAVGGNVSVYWLPYHHSNFMGARSRDVSRPVRSVGVHTIHHDQTVQEVIQKVVAEHRSKTGTNTYFTQFDPGALFRLTDGRIMTPQQTAEVYRQLATLDTTVVRMSGCVSQWWTCSRWRTGQRLLNALSVGIPAVVWGDAQGHRDIVEARWRSAALVSDVGQVVASAPMEYPRELVASGSKHEAEVALRKLLSNATLRQTARSVGLRIARRHSLPRISARLACMLRRLVRRRQARGRRDRQAAEWHRFRGPPAAA